MRCRSSTTITPCSTSQASSALINSATMARKPRARAAGEPSPAAIAIKASGSMRHGGSYGSSAATRHENSCSGKSPGVARHPGQRAAGAQPLHLPRQSRGLAEAGGGAHQHQALRRQRVGEPGVERRPRQQCARPQAGRLDLGAGKGEHGTRAAGRGVILHATDDRVKTPLWRRRRTCAWRPQDRQFGRLEGDGGGRHGAHCSQAVRRTRGRCDGHGPGGAGAQRRPTDCAVRGTRYAAADRARALPAQSPWPSSGIAPSLPAPINPTRLYTPSLWRVSAMSRSRIVSWPMRSAGVNAPSPFSIVRRSGW